MDKPERTKILLVDDHPERLLALQVILESLGQNLVSVASGDDALRELLRREFSVILLDVRMPGMDGFETAPLMSVPLQKALLLQQLQVLVGRAVGREPEVLADLAVRGSQAALPLERIDVLEDLLLATGQVRGHVGSVGGKAA